MYNTIRQRQQSEDYGYEWTRSGTKPIGSTTHVTSKNYQGPHVDRPREPTRTALHGSGSRPGLSTYDSWWTKALVSALGLAGCSA